MADVGYYRQATNVNGLGARVHTLGSATIGNSGMYGYLDILLNTMYAYPIHLPGGGRVIRLWASGGVYGGTQEVLLALYFNLSDTNLYPGAWAVTGTVMTDNASGGVCDITLSPGLYWIAALFKESNAGELAAVGEDGTSGDAGIPFLGFGNALGIGYLGYTIARPYLSGMPAHFPLGASRAVKLPRMCLDTGI